MLDNNNAWKYDIHLPTHTLSFYKFQLNCLNN